MNVNQCPLLAVSRRRLTVNMQAGTFLGDVYPMRLVFVALLTLGILSLQACEQTVVENCCTIVSIDVYSADGTAVFFTASDSATGGTFSFLVKPALSGHLQPGMSFDILGSPGISTFSMINIQNVPPDWGENCCTLMGETIGGAELERRK